MKFTYKAAKANGEVYESRGDFSDRYALYNAVREVGDTVISFDEEKKKQLSLASIESLLPMKRLSLLEILGRCLTRDFR
jgi:hypothetical protein